MKKFLTLFLALMAMLTVFTVAVSADEPALTEYTVFLDGTTKTQLYTSAEADGVITYTKAGANLKSLITGATEFKTLDDKTATVDASTGVVTPVKTGDVQIRVWDANGEKLGDFTVHVIKRTVTDIRITAPTKTYYVGDIIPNSDVKVKFDYNNGDSDTSNVATSEYTLSYEEGVVDGSGRLLASGENIKVTVLSKNNPAITDTYFEVNVINNIVTKLTLTIAGGGSQFVEGSVLPGLNVTAKFTNGSEATVAASQYVIYINGEAVTGSRLLKTTDKKLKVYYNGVFSNEISISVTEQSSGDDDGDTGDTGETSDNIGTISGTWTTKTYYVGEKIDWTGIKIVLKKGDTTVTTLSSELLIAYSNLDDSPFARVFVKDDVKGDGKTNLVLSYSYEGDTYLIAITGLTVKESLGKLDVVDIDAIVLDNKTYTTGQVLTLDDIDYVIFYVRKNGVSQSSIISGDDLDSYSNAMSLQVLTSAGKIKSSKTTTIESANIFQKDGKDYVNVRFTADDEYIDTTIPVSDPDVAVYYDSTLLANYASVDEALAAISELSTTEYPPINLKTVTIKLSNDETISSGVSFSVERRIEINLNGKKLTMDSDAFDPDMGIYYVTISNTSTTAGTLTYDDKDISIVLAKGETVTFDDEYDEDDLLPGVYVVTLDVGKNGEVESTPEANDDDEILIGHGSEIKFVITPKKGYMVESIALGTKKVNSSSSGYSEKDGVVTLTFKVDEDTNGKTLKVTFAEDDPLANWENPFSDVKDNADYIDAIAFVNVNGLLQGTSETKFSPTGTLTRAQFVTILGRLCGIDEELADALYGDRASNFKDVSKNDSNYGRYEYAVPYIIWATDEKLIEGHGGNRKGEFGPLDPITHEQMYVIMQRYAEKIEDLNTAAGTQVLQFSDKGSIQSWAVNAVKYAQKMDFIVETGTNKISPSTNAKRWELATLLQKFCINVLGWEGEIADEK